MDEVFQSHVASLRALLDKLISMPPHRLTGLPRVMPDRGVYLFSENGTHLYVGRSNRMRSRVRNHGRATASWRQAAFAFRLAREATGLIKPTYRKEGSRRQLMTDAKFIDAFEIAKLRIAQMDVRFVEETDPVRQCLLEIYVATALQARYNDFDNH